MTANRPLSVIRIERFETDNSASSPDALEDALKEHYFSVNPAEYFERRLWGIIALADLEEAGHSVWRPDDPDSLFSKYRNMLGKNIDVENPPGETSNSKTMASIESYTLMQHVIETALRLFVAAQARSIGKSPMTVLLHMKRAKDLRDPIRPLLGSAARQVVAATLFPKDLYNPDVDKQLQELSKHLDYATAWLSFFARFYADDHFGGAQGNNQLKHGAAVAPRGDITMSLHQAEEPPSTLNQEEWAAASPIINAESISYVEFEHEQGKVPGLRLRTDNSDPATNLAITRIGISLVRSLWQMSRAVAIPLTEIEYEFDWSPMPEDLFERTDKPPRSVLQVLLAPAQRTSASTANASRRRTSPAQNL